MKINLNIVSVALAALLAGFSSCREFLEKEPLSSVTSEDVWNSEKTVNTYVNGLYYNLMPGWPYGMANPGAAYLTNLNWFWSGWTTNWDKVNFGNGNGTDEAVPPHRFTDKILLGTATKDWLNTYDNGADMKWAVNAYASIRTANSILAKIDAASFSGKDAIKGQALFWRAWAYHSLVKDVGGMPLILEPQAADDDLTQIQKPRNKTSECVTQILADLDAAIALLPNVWSGADAGRIDKGAAMAFKGRVLLFYASPLFNGLGGVASWQKAYDANKAALDFLKGQGKKLQPNFSDIWYQEGNNEQIMVRRFTFPESYYEAPGNAPLAYSGNDWGCDLPSLALVDAFPMKDGSKFVGNSDTYPTLFQNRDDRFYATICYNGAPVQFTPKMQANKQYWWTFVVKIKKQDGSPDVDGAVSLDESGTGLKDVTAPKFLRSGWRGEGQGELFDFFLKIKGVDRKASSVGSSDVDWPEIRFAEVLMNFGEAANEIGRTDEALQALYAIRQRAGISGGGGTYGITASSPGDVRQAYVDERFVEFAFEGKRWDDLRRWKRFDLLRGKQRQTLAITLKEDDAEPAPMDDINEAYKLFNYTVVNCDKENLTLPDKMYLYGLPFSFLSRNPKLGQNNLWDGNFNPFE